METFDNLSREELIAVARLQAERIAELEQKVSELLQEVEVLRERLGGGGRGNGLPPFVKPSRPKREGGEKKARKKRAQAFVRKREEATREEIHAVERCPGCGRKLEGGTVHRRRQVIEIPETPVEVIDHVLVRRRCGVCKKSYVPKLGVADGVVGQHRVGPRLMSLIATLCTEHRLPRASTQRLLRSVYRVHLSVGEISEILHTVAGLGQEQVEAIRREVREAPYVHADETGWREDGVNGYLWGFCTPRVRLFHRAGSRSGAVARGILLGKWEQEDGGIYEEECEPFRGWLVCDCYSGYSWYEQLQRCWDHLCRKLKELKAKYADNPLVVEWVGRVVELYEQAKKVSRAGLAEAERVRWRRRFDAALLALTKPYVDVEGAPQREVAVHISRFQSEWFAFVQHPGVPSGNNAAERALRPTVIARKVSGGTRSPKGSKTMCALRTLFGTWALNGRDTLQACFELLTTPTPTPATAPPG